MRVFLLINAVSFLLAALLEYHIEFAESGPAKAGGENRIRMREMVADMKESFRDCQSNKIILIISVFMIFMNFILQLGFTVPLPYIINHTLHLSSRQYGVIQGMTSLGVLSRGTFFR